MTNKLADDLPKRNDYVSSHWYEEAKAEAWEAIARRAVKALEALLPATEIGGHAESMIENALAEIGTLPPASGGEERK